MSEIVLNINILNVENQKFINDNLNSDIKSLMLKGIRLDGVSDKEIVEQIESKKKAETKLPTWFNTAKIYYPNKLNIEQTSSEITASYKASLISGRTLIDITGGFGVDAFYFSKRFEQVVHCETNKALSLISKHNFDALKAQNIDNLFIDGIEHLKMHNTSYDWIYCDPSRRHDEKGKVYFLKDCIPNIPEHLPLLLQRSENLLVKTSPLLDISMGIKDLNCVKDIHVVAVNNEVKEILWVLNKNFYGNKTIYAINLGSDANVPFTVEWESEKRNEANYSLPLAYLYEPNTAILKTGAFNCVANQFNVHKLHQHSHLYTSNELVQFPGRRFSIECVVPYNRRASAIRTIEKANISTRNFPESVHKIRETFKIKDGGDAYLFFTTDLNGQKVVIICSKI